MQKQKRILFTFLFLSIVLFFLIDIFTIEYKGNGRISGNGNLGLLFVIPVIPIYLFTLVLVYNVSRSFYRNLKNIFVLLSVFLPLLCICLYGEYHFAHSLFDHLGGGPSTPKSVIYRWPLLNQYTNTLFFNIFTFTTGFLLSLMISLYVELFIRRKINQSINNSN